MGAVCSPDTPPFLPGSEAGPVPRVVLPSSDTEPLNLSGALGCPPRNLCAVSHVT